MSEKKATATVKENFRAQASQMQSGEEMKTRKRNETTKSAAAKKTTTARKSTRTRAKSASAGAGEMKNSAAAESAVEVILQWNGNDYTAARLLQSAKDVWQFDLGKNVADFGTAQIYVKPEDGKAYVVVNGTSELSFDI